MMAEEPEKCKEGRTRELLGKRAFMERTLKA
jgi:hypothetical protein